MWWKKDGEDHPGSTPQSARGNNGVSGDGQQVPGSGGGGGSGKKKSIILVNRRRLMGGGRQSAGAAETAPSTSSSAGAGDKPSVHVAETMSGIEVSFSDEVRASPDHKNSNTKNRLQQKGDPHRAVKGMMSFGVQMARRRKIYRAQFNVGSAASGSGTANNDGNLARDFKVGKHRVPIFGKKPLPSFDDALFLLRSHEVRDEFSCVREELTRINTEITALEKDRNKLEHRAINIIDDGDGDGTESNRNDSKRRWDINYILSSETLSQQERNALQERRGLSLTVSLHNQQARENLVARCGSIASVIRAEQQRAKNSRSKKSSSNNSGSDDVISFTPKTCRAGGAAATIQQISLLKGANNSETGFFISRDKGKSYSWGHLPDRLFRRMKNAGLDPEDHATDLTYLSTGPMGCYYAQFRSGECWWGSIVEDTEFDAICKDRDWDIYRVVFGAGSTVTDSLGHKHATTSWIILGRDGRAAWKNLPARLHNKLEGRLASESAPAEVALGSGGSYFIRFTCGTTDYCLPSKVAHVCRSLEKEGTAITSISLHPELPKDFAIRHR